MSDPAQATRPHKARPLDDRRDRLYRLITSPLRATPDFIIVGAQKGGTTSLYRHLGAYVPVLPALTKEVHYFDRRFEKGVYWHRAKFPLLLSKRYLAARRRHDYVTGEATPTYLFYPDVPGRIAKLLPRVRLIALLRNPVDRALSHFYHQVRKNVRHCLFEDTIAAEFKRLDGEVQKIKDQILILKSEDLFDQPGEVFGRVIEFLQLPGQPAEDFGQFNVGRYEQISAATRRRLADYFEPYNRQLYEFLGVDFGWQD